MNMARGTNRVNAANSKSSRTSGREAENDVPTSICVNVPRELQQRCLNIFRDALKPSGGDQSLLQEVKGHLYDRNFATAFSQEEYLRVYASRWSASRGLGYLQILAEFQDTFFESTDIEDNLDHSLTVACLGGGAGAEIVALAGWLHLAKSKGKVSNSTTVTAKCLDIAAWESVATSLHNATITPAKLSTYASSAAKEANVALLPEDGYHVDFEQVDILAMSEDKSRAIFAEVELVTIMFTLNELYATSMPKTQQMLGQITTSLSPGAYLLVVDSPGSYSMVSINGAEKKYPMQWLMDHTLVGSREKNGEKALWYKMATDQSRWFRLPQGLQYPIDLENMRYQVHLYRRLGDAREE